METPIVNNSARGTASQMPLTSNTNGSSSIDSRRKTKVRRKEMMAETLPLERAVNIPEEKTLMPTNKKLMANSLNQEEVMENTSPERETKTEISASQHNSANSSTPMALTATKRMLMVKIRCSCT